MKNVLEEKAHDGHDTSHSVAHTLENVKCLNGQKFVLLDQKAWLWSLKKLSIGCPSLRLQCNMEIHNSIISLNLMAV